MTTEKDNGNGSHKHGTKGVEPSFPTSLQNILDSLKAQEDALALHVAEPFHYSTVLQHALNQQTDAWVADGTMSKNNTDTPLGPSRTFTRPPPISPDFARTVVYDNARSLSILRTLRQVAVRSVVRYLHAARCALAESDFLVAFLCFRSTLEQIAHLALTDKELKKLHPEDAIPGAFKFIAASMEILAKKLYATRFAWAKINNADEFEALLAAEDLVYKPDEERIDTTAKSCLAGIDLLNKRIRGIRVCYDILCEFAHPNVGNLIMFTASANPRIDAGGVPWIDKSLENCAPGYLLSELGFVIERVCGVVLASMNELHATILPSMSHFESHLQIAVKAHCRYIVSNNRALFDGYALCPCQSGHKTKFCCGKR